MKKNNTARQSAKGGAKQGRSGAGGVTIGVDVGDKPSRCCGIDQDGEVRFEGSVATTQKGMVQVFGPIPHCRIAVEVGTHSPWALVPSPRRTVEILLLTEAAFSRKPEA